MTPLPDLYARLEARPDDSPESLRASYRAAARRSHPDVGGDHQRFLEIDASWQVLGYPSSRWCYDAFWILSILMADETHVDVGVALRAANDATLAANLCSIPLLLHDDILALHASIPRWLADVEHRADAGDRPRTPSAGQSRLQRFAPYWGAPVVGLGPLDPDVHTVVTAGVTSMMRWQATNRLLRSIDLDERRTARDATHEAYQSLRAAQDLLVRPGAVRTDAAARVYFHICWSVLALRTLLVDPSVRLSRVYPVTDEEWSRARAEESLEILASRQILPGAAPWAPLDELSGAVADAVRDAASTASVAASACIVAQRGPTRTRPVLQQWSRWSSRCGSGMLVTASIALLGLGPGSTDEGDGRGVVLLALVAGGLALVSLGAHLGSRSDRAEFDSAPDT